MSFQKFASASGLILFLLLSVNAQSSDASSVIKLGNQLFSNQQYKLAIKEYQRVSPNKREEYARALYNIGVCYYELWVTDEAIEYYGRALELKHGEYPSASFALEGRIEEAASLFTSAIAQPGQHQASSHNNLGVMLARMGQLNAAEREFQMALSGELPEADHNLKLCRALLISANNQVTHDQLRVSMDWHGGN